MSSLQLFRDFTCIACRANGKAISGDQMKRIREFFCVYSFGATAYCLIEVLFRGFTHWSMGLTGGAALLGIYCVNEKYKHVSLFKRCLMGCGIITALELFVGLLVNKLFRWQVWDYSARPLNLFGQICPLFSLFWFLLSFPACMLCKLLKKQFGCAQ